MSEELERGVRRKANGKYTVFLDGRFQGQYATREAANECSRRITAARRKAGLVAEAARGPAFDRDAAADRSAPLTTAMARAFKASQQRPDDGH